MPTQLTPEQIAAMMGNLQPPPGYLAGQLEAPGASPNGPQLLPGGIRATAAQPLPPGNTPLDSLREQMGTIEQLSGREQQLPQIGTVLDPGSPTYGLAALGSRHFGGGMVGDQRGPSLRANDVDVLQGQQGLAANRQRPTEALLGRLGEMGRQALSGGQLSLDTMRLLGPGGTLAQGQSLIDTNAATRLHDQQNAADFQQFAQGQRAQGRNEDEIEWAWTHNQDGQPTGRRLPSTRGGQPFQNQGAGPPGTPINPGQTQTQSPLPGGISPTEMAAARAEALARNPDLAQGAAPIAARSPIDVLGGTRESDSLNNVPTGGGRPNARPWSSIESRLNEAAGYRPPTTANGVTTPGGIPADSTVGTFINRLEASHPGTLAGNWPAIQAYITRQFPNGAHVLEQAMQRAVTPRQIATPANPIQALLRGPGNMATLLRQAANGPSEEEYGLSGLGNFIRSQQRTPPLPQSAQDIINGF